MWLIHKYETIISQVQELPIIHNIQWPCCYKFICCYNYLEKIYLFNKEHFSDSVGYYEGYLFKAWFLQNERFKDFLLR